MKQRDRPQLREEQEHVCTPRDDATETHDSQKFPVAIGKEILPLLRKQRGFLDEFLLMTPEKREVVAIGLWETEERPENDHRDVYPQVEEILNRFAEGIPVVMKFEPQYSTFHEIAFAATA